MAPGTRASEILQLLRFSDPEEKVDEGKVLQLDPSEVIKSPEKVFDKLESL